MKLDLFTAVLLFSSAMLGFLGAALVARFGGPMGLIDRPSHRSSHSVPTPKGGGIGALAALVLVGSLARVPLPHWAPTAAASALGLMNDRSELSPRLRLFLQFACAALVVMLSRTPAAWTVQQIALSLFWVVFIVGTANYYNFMDGINGIAGITGVVAFGLLWFAISKAHPGHPHAQLAASLALACAGFLPLNLPSAKVFMGDVGALLLGFMFASLVYLHSSTLLDFVTFASFLFPFYTDELLTLVVRLRDRDRLTVAHRRHIYQLLANQRGVAHWKISVGYGVANLAIGAGAMLLRRYGLWWVSAFLVGCFGLCAIFGSLLRNRVERVETGATEEVR